MSITCKFELSRSSNIYYSGEQIVGSLTICSLKRSQTEAFILEFFGQSTVQWWELDKTEENIKHNDFSTHEVSDKVLYNFQQKHVCEQLKLDSLNNKQLQPHVEYTLKFCFPIPQQVPATYSCMYGQTEYGLRLRVQRTKKADKHFHQRIVVRNKLDLKQSILHKKPYAVYRDNEFGQINLQIPCSGFTPGQKIPYYLQYQTKQVDCKAIVQLNCYTTCRTDSNCNKFKQVKQIINFIKRLSPGSNSGYINIPLYCHISSTNDSEWIINNKYMFEALLISGSRKVLLSVSIPITIGTSPCYTFDGDLENVMCYNNLGSSCSDLSSWKNQPSFFKLPH